MPWRYKYYIIFLYDGRAWRTLTIAAILRISRLGL